ncbi:MAG: hypothetical protein IPJ88_10735 [Myxococcales bacterium]|nr:MAG: hypothetical protein IPJ88_10735 [Myxococcales bacterium]
MAFAYLSEKDIEIIGQCLVASVNGPFFPDWEFATLFGLEREEVGTVMRTWPNVLDDDNSALLAVKNALGNLVGYPHGEELSQFVSATPEQLLEILKRYLIGTCEQTSYLKAVRD